MGSVKNIIDKGQSVFQEICLLNLVMDSIFTGHTRGAFAFDWNVIDDHGGQFKSEYDYNDARILLQLSLMVSNANFRNIPLEVPDWLIDHPLIYDMCPVAIGKTSEKNPNHMLVHVLYNTKTNIIFIIFTGTVDICMAGIDVTYSQTEFTGTSNYGSGMKVHSGMHAAYLSIRPRLIEILKSYWNNKPQIIIAGHSLGGGLSNICALDLAYYNPLHYSFASPLVFNPLSSEVFDKLVKRSYRVSNISDLVTLAPLPVMPNKDVFCHVGTTISFQKNLGDYRDNHTLAYIQMYNIPFIELPPMKQQ